MILHRGVARTRSSCNDTQGKSPAGAHSSDTRAPHTTIYTPTSTTRTHDIMGMEGALLRARLVECRSRSKRLLSCAADVVAVDSAARAITEEREIRVAHNAGPAHNPPETSHAREQQRRTRADRARHAQTHTYTEAKKRPEKHVARLSSPREAHARTDDLERVNSSIYL